MANQGQTIKEKIKHFLHHDKHPMTTPDASPGYADVGTQEAPHKTTNVPEAFYPGAMPVVPKETHSTAPYSSALGQHQISPKESSPNQSPQQPTSVPGDSSAMLGAPPSGKDSKKVAPPKASTAAPVPEGAESDVQTKGTESGVQIEDSPDNESKVQTDDYPISNSVVEEKDDNPGPNSEGEKTGQEFDPVDEGKTEEKSTYAQPAKDADDKTEQKFAQENA